jgi:hypothetical protein
MALNQREDTDPLDDMQRSSRRIARLTRDLTREVAAFKAAAARAGIGVEFVHGASTVDPTTRPQSERTAQ